MAIFYIRNPTKYLNLTTTLQLISSRLKDYCKSKKKKSCYSYWLVVSDNWNLKESVTKFSISKIFYFIKKKK